MLRVFCSPLGAEPRCEQVEGRLPLLLGHVLEADARPRRPVHVVPSAPLDVVRRERGGFALLGRQGFQECLRRLHHRFRRDAGRADGEQPGARRSVGGHALERVGSGILAAELRPRGKRGEEDENEEGWEQESAMHRERVAQTPAPRRRVRL